MIHSTSARRNGTYTPYSIHSPIIGQEESLSPLHPQMIPKPVMLMMLKKENEYRLSEEYQKKYEEAEKSDEKDWLKVTEEIQARVIIEFGYDTTKGHLGYALQLMRSAPEKYKDDPEFRQVPLYVKYNRAQDGDLKEGDVAPNTKVMDLQGNECDLLDQTSNGIEKPVVLIGGSYS